MNSFSVEFSPVAEKDLRKLDVGTRTLISRWIKNNLVGCANPRACGKPLKGKYKHMWCYRVGEMRILAQIEDDCITIYIVTLGHRKDVYRDRA